MKLKKHRFAFIASAIFASTLLAMYILAPIFQATVEWFYVSLKNASTLATSFSSAALLLGLCLVAITFLITHLVIARRKIKKLLKAHKEVLLQQHQEVALIKDKLQDYEEQIKNQGIAKEKFLSIISRDLRTPLLALKSYAYTLKTKDGNFMPWELASFSASLEKPLNHLITVLNNVSRWSMAQTNWEPVQTDSININKMIAYTLKLMKPTADKKKVALLKNINCEVIAMSDAHMVEFILRNIVSNAIKFSHENSAIILKLRENDEVFTISVKDNGIGMDSDTVSKLFTIDQKPNAIDLNSSSPSHTGLSLMLCKEFVQKMGGTLEVQSQINEGSTFTISLPKKVYQPLQTIKQQ